MSAYLCNTEHFKALAIFAAQREHGSMRVDPRYVGKLVDPGIPHHHTEEWASLYANVLKKENVRSVEHRYKDPSDMVDDEQITVTLNDSMSPSYKVSAVAILKMCDGLEYQSCETDDWNETTAFNILKAIRAAATRSLPGYEAAQWSFELASLDFRTA